MIPSTRVATDSAAAAGATPPTPGGGTSRRRRAIWKEVAKSSAFLTTLSFVIMLVLWQGLIVLFDIKTFVLPSLGEIGSAFKEQSGPLAEATVTTLRETLIGFGLAVVVAFPIGVLIAFSAIARRMAYPIVLGAQAIPKIGLAPVFLIWFGFGELPKDMIAALIAFFPIVISTTVGLREIDPDLLHVARASRASSLRIFWKIRLPVAMPSLFSGFKIGMSLAVTGAVVGEFIAGSSGLGYLTYASESLQNTPLAFAAMFLLVLVSLLLFYAIDLIEFVLRRHR